MGGFAVADSEVRKAFENKTSATESSLLVASLCFQVGRDWLKPLPGKEFKCLLSRTNEVASLHWLGGEDKT